MFSSITLQAVVAFRGGRSGLGTIFDCLVVQTTWICCIEPGRSRTMSLVLRCRTSGMWKKSCWWMFSASAYRQPAAFQGGYRLLQWWATATEWDAGTRDRGHWLDVLADHPAGSAVVQ
jgi:hypothetical protein